MELRIWWIHRGGEAGVFFGRRILRDMINIIDNEE